MHKEGLVCELWPKGVWSVGFAFTSPYSHPKLSNNAKYMYTVCMFLMKCYLNKSVCNECELCAAGIPPWLMHLAIQTQLQVLSKPIHRNIWRSTNNITTDSNGKKSHILMQIVPTQSKRKKQVITSAILARNLTWHIDLKHLTSLEKYLQMNDGQK